MGGWQIGLRDNVLLQNYKLKQAIKTDSLLVFFTHEVNLC